GRSPAGRGRLGREDDPHLQPGPLLGSRQDRLEGGGKPEDGQDQAGARVGAAPAREPRAEDQRRPRSPRKRFQGRAALACEPASASCRAKKPDRRKPQVSLKNFLAIAIGILSAIGRLIYIGNIVIYSKS